MMIDDFITNYGRDLTIIFLTIAVLLTVGKIVIEITKRALRKITDKTKSKLDDLIISSTEHVIEWIIFFAGLRVGINLTNFASVYPSEIDHAFFTIWTLLIAYIEIKVVNVVLEYKSKEIGIGTATFIKKINKLTVLTLALLVILGHFNVEISPIIASLGIAGLAVALALQDTLANLFSGLYITADQPIRPGDFIEVDGVSGQVLNIGWRSTKLRTPENNIIIIPNKKLSESIILNYNLPNNIVSTSVEVEASYKHDPEKVIKILKEVAEKVRDEMEECEKDFEPIVRTTEFKSSGIGYKVIMRVKERGMQFSVKDKLIREIYKTFKKKKIEIPYAIYEVHLKK